MSDVLEKIGKNVVILGNEAIARGAIESGVGVVTAYPGTPSSEIAGTLSEVAKKLGFYFEYSVNEKVAFETATGASWSNVRAITAMKHYGLNVASDSILPVAYTGVKAGLVIVVTDDPEGWGSIQSEQDTRYYARMSKMPMIEPSNPQECLDYTKLAFEISEEFEIPIFIRTTTNVSHSIGTVELGKIRKSNTNGMFQKDPTKFYMIKPKLQELHEKLNVKLDKIEKKFGNKLNKVYPGKGKIGIISSGASFEYVKELLQELKLDIPIAKIGLTYPLSKKFINNSIKNKKAVLVLEELEPIIEEFVRQVAKDTNPNLVIHGKDMLSRTGEYNLERIAPIIEKIFRKKLKINLLAHKKQVDKILEKLPPRKPVLCAGCPHRSTFYAVKKVFGDRTIYSGDLGCYLLGIYEPFKMEDFIISMGASLGLAHGITRVSNQEIVIFIGDSTFFHAGMPGLLNLRYNNDKSPLIVVMDNGTTAMTGHQPDPSSDLNAFGEKVEPIKIEDIVKSFGVEVRVASAFNQKQLIQTLEELKKVKGIRVLVSRGECRLLTRRKYRKLGLQLPKFEMVPGKSKDCEFCIKEFACPAILKIRKSEYKIDQELCLGCSVCMQICPKGAVKSVGGKNEI